MIDWSKLKPYRASSTQSFEQLCYQVAKALYSDMGIFTAIDDTGGGDGVEFFLTLPGGDEWGWQAKFFHPSPRLNESNRKAQITKSLRRACEKHPRLIRWFLCTPTDFTTEERSWFSRLQGQDRNELNLDHWGDSEFNNWLSEPCFTGKRNYFFGELELSLDWFRRQVERQTTSIRDKFNETLHLETDTDQQVHTLLGDKTAATMVQDDINWATDVLVEFTTSLNQLREVRRFSHKFQWADLPETYGKLVSAAISMSDVLVVALERMKQAQACLQEQRLKHVRQLDVNTIVYAAQDAFHEYERLLGAFDFGQLQHTGKPEEKETDFRWARQLLFSPRYHAERMINRLQRIASQLDEIKRTDLHIFGDAGYGKTHLACHICAERIAAGLPALLVPGSLFRSGEIVEVQLRAILDIPPAYSWDDFVKALAAAAEAHETRIPIVIDGLNESTTNGAFSPIWSLGIPSLVSSFANIDEVALITTCRSTYQSAIWGKASGQNFAYINGFTGEVTEAAVETYFAWYKIRAIVTAVPLDHFRHPIYLKLFCESINPSRQSDKVVHLGEYTLFQVFDNFLDQCNKIICEKLSFHPSARVVEDALMKVAGHLWESKERRLPFALLAELIDGQTLETLNYDHSKTKAILSEGLLIYQDWHHGDDVALFSYDLMAGYLIAKYLLAHASDDLKIYFNSEPIKELLFLDNYRSLHPLANDIGRSLAALLPIRTRQYIYDLVQTQVAQRLYIDGLFEIPVEHVQQRCVDQIAHLFETPQNRKRLLSCARLTVAHMDHPLNVKFWSKLLQTMPMAERDISWSEHVRENLEHFEKVTERFERTCRQNEAIDSVGAMYLHLLAEYLRWLLTSTLRPLRDGVTRALYWYGRRFPIKLTDLVLDSLKMNDPYIPERMLAAMYGVAMARQHDFQDLSFTADTLPVLGRRLYEAMFQSEAMYGTTHVLMRDYARYTIAIALRHHPDLLASDEKVHIKPPFNAGGIRDWGKAEDREKGQYRDGNAPVQMDFGNYTLGRLIRKRSNYDYNNPDYKKVLSNLYWRLYDLGYSVTVFGDADRQIAHTQDNGRMADGRKTDRYGKKYSWIAYYEIYGYRQDTTVVGYEFDDPWSHITDVDIDPSFPEEEPHFNVVTANFLEQDEMPLQEWIMQEDAPDLCPYLVIENLCGETGNWVLLDGDIIQDDMSRNRRFMAFVHGIVIAASNAERFAVLLRQQHPNSRYFAIDPPNDHYIYAGEIPWCNTYPLNGWVEEKLEAGTDVVISQRKQTKVLRHGTQLSEEDVKLFLDSAQEVLAHADEMAFNKWLEEADIELVEETVPIGENRLRFEKFMLHCTVRSFSWESHHSAVNPGQSVSVPSKDIADSLNLCSQPQTFDLYEITGRRASISLRFSDALGRAERLTYLRQDLLEKYLQSLTAKLVWSIAGERAFHSNNYPEMEAFEQNAPRYKQFANTIVLP